MTGPDDSAQPSSESASRSSFLLLLALGLVALAGLILLGRSAGGYVPQFAEWVDRDDPKVEEVQQRVREWFDTRREDVRGQNQRLREAIELDDDLNYDEPWGWMQPTRHALGALLLEGVFAHLCLAAAPQIQR